ncbi:MAG: Ig-like domain-containing protein [Kiritimatiellae bacterium]|nr:Ig-like domain-containing protein [Kiritimatiellia bacterium]MDW8457482.1 Ig-like domain-containing protein [Verrucomicrobiota bacterium]
MNIHSRAESLGWRIRLACLAVGPLWLWLNGSVLGASIDPAIIPYGVGEGNYGTNGVGQTVGVIPNPGVGDYRWGWQDPYPWGTPAGGWADIRGIPTNRVLFDEYKRFVWRAIEPSPGVYNFSVITQHLEQARLAGRRFAFRIQILSEYEGDIDNDGQADGLMGAPDYIEQQGLGRRMASTKPECNGIFVPYWNNTNFLARVEALYQALGAAFDGDPRLAYVDVGIYGHWGEWHMSGLGFTNLPIELNATPETRARLVDMAAAAFQKTRLLMIPDTDGDYPERSGTGFAYAMERYPRMGVRKDNLSHYWFEDEVGPWFPNINAAFSNRWKTTPLVVEFFGGEDTPAMMRAETQVIRYAVSQVALNSYNTHTQRIEIGKAAGFRFQLNRAAWPDSVEAGHRFVITSRWSNVGVAPAYEKWAPVWELYSGTSLVWSARSRLDFQQLLPTTVNGDFDVNTEETEANGKNVPVTILDELAVPASLPPGSYSLKVAVLLQGTNHYQRPLSLAIQGRDANGRYSLGTLSVSAPANPAPQIAWVSPSVSGRVSEVWSSTPSVATGNAAIAYVELLVDGAVRFSNATAPYTLSWTPSTAQLAVLVARVTDTAGRRGVTPPLAVDIGPLSNRSPNVSLNVLNSGPYEAPTSLVLSASVSDPDGDSISKVEFYRGNVLFATRTNAPYMVTNFPVTASIHSYLAKAFDSRGARGYGWKTVEVNNPPKGPYGGTAPVATNRIEFENYDVGGPGISWHDTTPNNEGGAYRIDSVDIQPTGDSGGGHHVGWVNNGEWLDYTIWVPESNEYGLRVRYASPTNFPNPRISLYVDGSLAISNVAIPANGRWNWDYENWQTWTSPVPAHLSRGTRVIRIFFEYGAGNYNWLSFAPVGPQRFADWISDLSVTGTAASAAADPDGDGWANLMEYALGGHPMSATNVPLIEWLFETNRWRLRYQPTPSRGVSLFVDASTNLFGGFAPAGTLTNSPPNTWHHYLDAASTNDQRFLRVRAQE